MTNCKNKTNKGCKECEDGYYLDNKYCRECSSECKTCNSIDMCTECSNGYIKDRVSTVFHCLNITEVEHCTQAKNSMCSKCSKGYKPSKDGITCEEKNSIGMILGIVFGLLLVIMIIIFIIIIVIIVYYFKKKRYEKEKNICIFKMSKSNVKFIHYLNRVVVSNKEVVKFNLDSDELIPVNEETRDLICIGNQSKNELKIQISTKEGCDKYEIRTEPQLVTLKSGEACEFEIFVKPLCTSDLKDQIMIIALDIKKGKQYSLPFDIEYKTKMTTRLDYGELNEEKKLGEGSFGVVYKGTFRKHIVAIKKMKEASGSSKQMEEFNKEVAMLDKFRCDYIVHFYGAVFIPTKIAMVTNLLTMEVFKI